MNSVQLSFASIIGLLLPIVTAYTLNKVIEQNHHTNHSTVCRDDDCQIMANVIMATMNESIDPCDNFYEYACGAWIHSNATLPPQRPTWTRMAMITEHVSKTFRELLDSKDDDEEPVEKAKQWYRSCMYEDDRDSRGIDSLTSLAIAVGGWPIATTSGQWIPSDYTWQEIEQYYSRIMGTYAMYDLTVSVNSDNPTLVHQILVSAFSVKKAVPHNWILRGSELKGPKLPLSRDSIQVPRQYFDHADRTPYGKLIAGVAKAYAISQGSQVSDENITKEVEDMIEFEIKLDRIKNDRAVAVNTISRLQYVFEETTPYNNTNAKIDILRLVRNMVEGIGGMKITEDEVISVRGFYVLALRRLLNNTSFRTIVNYVHWYYLSHMLHATNSELESMLTEFERETLGIREPLPRWQKCVDQMQLNHALSYQFVKKHFTENTYNLASEMITRIQIELERQINGSTWMTEKTKNVSKEKLWDIKTFIGYPDWYKNVTNLEKYYEELTIGNNYFNNIIKYMRFMARKTIRLLRTPVERPGWLSDPITVNALYIMDTNSLNIPAVLFQPPIFGSAMPDAVKYGIIGSMIGHELSHAFDITGFHYDKDGNEIDWQADMMKAYYERSLCFIKRDIDNRPSIVESIIEKLRTTGEDIADTTGLESVLGAYRSLMRSQNIKNDRKLPGFENFSNEQLFFLSYATIWCEMSTSKYARKKALSGDSHSSSRTRVIATISNTEGFAEAFNCSVESAMNPADKCNIWTGTSSPEFGTIEIH